jgi:(2Fe-2S) ferredoxin
MDDDQTRFSIEDAIYKKLLKTYEKEMMDLQTGLTVQTPGMRAPVKPTRPRPVETYTYRLSKATLNGVLDQLRTQPFLGLFSSEAGEMFNGHAFQGGRNDISKSIEMTTGLTNMWDGNELVRQTGQTESNLRLRNRAVNMMFFLQEATVRDVLSNKMFSEQGFVHRLLITQAESQPDPQITDIDEYFRQRQLQKQSLEPFHERILDIISTPLRTVEDRIFELDPLILEMTASARNILVDYRNRNRNRAREDLERYAGFAERLTEQMLRIAGTLAVFDLKTVIDDASMLAAGDLMDYFCEQRLNLEVGVTSRNPDLVSGAEKLLHWMQQRSFTGTRREIRNYVRWFKALSAEEADRILEELVLDGAVVMEERTNAKGRPCVVYKIAEKVSTS